MTLFFVIPQGRFTIAAKHHITIAEIYETELVDIEKVSSGFSFSYTWCEADSWREGALSSSSRVELSDYTWLHVEVLGAWQLRSKMGCFPIVECLRQELVKIYSLFPLCVIHVRRIFISFAEASAALWWKLKYCGHLHTFIFRPWPWGRR